MNNSPKVSILMPCFNGSQYIERSFESILAQSYPSVELIFVDDGSTDDSSVIASAYTERFNTKGYKLVIHRQKNGGFCAAVVYLCFSILQIKRRVHSTAGCGRLHFPRFLFIAS